MATNTATSFNDHTGNNTAGPFNISFNYLDQNEVDVIVDGDLKTINDHYTFTTASTISFTNSNFPAQNAKIRFQRDTNISAKKVDFSDGSVLTESDLDLQNNQLLYGLQESIDTITHDYFQLDGSKCLTGNICFEGATTDDNETVFGVTDPTADQTYLLPNLGAGTYAIHTSGSPDIITNTHIASGTIIDDNVAPNADIKGTKIEPEFGSQVIRQKVSGYGMALYPNCQISMGMTNDISSGLTMRIGPSTSGNYDGNGNNYIDNYINLGHPNLGTPGGLGGYQNEVNQGGGSSGNGHRATVSIGRLSMQARKWDDASKSFGYVLRIDGRDGCMFYSPDNSSFSNYENIPGGWLSTSPPSTSYTATVAQNMDRCRDAADFRIINGGAKANNKLEIGSSTTTGTLSLSGKDITSIIINSAAVAHTANDASVFTTSGSDARYFRQDTSETITSGITWSGDDAHVATTGAIDARIVDLVDDVGGFVPIANETSFPNANPDVNNGAGTLLSVPLANNITSNGSGVISIANGTIGNSTVTINGAANNTTYSTGFGIIVETTSTLNTYTFHRYVPKATEVTTVAGIASDVTTVGGISTNVTTVAGISSNVTTVANAITNVNNVGGSIANVNTCATNLTSINNFADRYQIASSNPSTDGGGNALADGDLYFDTTNNLLKVYNGTAWQGGITATEDLLLKSGDQMTGNLTFSGNQTVDGRDVSVDGTKLDGIAANANNYSISSDLLDEDDMATNSATKVASQQSIKAYVDTADALKASLSGATFTGDVIFDGATAGRDITYDRSADNLIFSTNTRAVFGNGSDLQIYATGSNSTIAHNGDGDLIISTAAGEKIYFDSTEFNFRNAASDETLIKATENGEVILYWANSPKLATKNAGVQITGQLMNFTTGTAVLLGDNAQLEIGSSNDLKIWHNADGDSYIRNESGNLLIEANGAGDDAIKIVPDGAVELYWDGSKKLETVTGGISVTGVTTTTGTINAADNHVQLMLDSGNGRIKLLDSSDNTTVDIFGSNGAITTTGSINIGSSTHTSRKLAIHDTTNTAIVIEGASNGSSSILFADENDEDVGFISYNHENDDLELVAADDIIIKAADDAVIQVQGGENAVLCNGNGGVELFYDAGTYSNPKLETTSTGAKVTGGLEVTGTAPFINFIDSDHNSDFNIQINGGGLNFNDTTNSATRMSIDSDGNTTISGNIVLDADDKYLQVGDGQEGLFGHNDSSLQITNSKGWMFIGNGTTNVNPIYIRSHQSYNQILCNHPSDGTSAAGNVILYSGNGSERFRTNTDGVLIQGSAQVASIDLNGTTDTHPSNGGMHRHSNNYVYVAGKSDGNGTIISNGDGTATIRALSPGGTDGHIQMETGAGSLRAQITDTGYFKAGPNSAGVDPNSSIHQFSNNVSNWTFYSKNHATSGNPYGIACGFTGLTPDNQTSQFLQCFDATTTRLYIYSDGDVVTADDGTLTSDQTLKENIVDATPKLEDLKKIKVRNFNWKASYHPEKSKKKQLGFIAQEVEEVFPALISEHDISPGDHTKDDHTPVMKKAIKQAWAPILVKAMQELIEKVEVLETEVAALKGA